MDENTFVEILQALTDIQYYLIYMYFGSALSVGILLYIAFMQKSR